MLAVWVALRASQKPPEQVAFESSVVVPDSAVVLEHASSGDPVGWDAVYLVGADQWRSVLPGAVESPTFADVVAYLVLELTLDDGADCLVTVEVMGPGQLSGGFIRNAPADDQLRFYRGDALIVWPYADCSES